MMRTFILFLLLTVSVSAIAKPSGGSSGGTSGGRLTVEGFYGLGGVNPTDINNIASTVGGTPPLNAISTEYLYGGGIGLMISRKIQAKIIYEGQEAKNLVTMTTPAINDGGFTLQWSEIWGEINYHFVRTKMIYVYVGGSLGYPTNSHVIANLSTKTEYDADKTLGYMAQAGFGVMLGSRISLFFQVEYQNLISGDLKDGAGNYLTQSDGTSHAKLDLSGKKAHAGLVLHF